MIQGNAVEIIKDAMALGILCRPRPYEIFSRFVDELGPGEALIPEKDSFEHYMAQANHYVGLFNVTPEHLLMPWELVTKGMLLKEYEKHVEFEVNPFWRK